MKNNEILVVEDERIVGKDIQNTLQELGYSVFPVVSTGEEAIKSVEKNRPDLVLMDIKLKGKMDGIKAAEEIHKNFDIPIIYLTAYADEETINRAKFTSANGYIVKPFEKRELKSNIEIALYKNKMEQKLRIKDHAISSSINGIVITDVSGNIDFVNDSFMMMWGYKNRDDVIGKPLVQFWRSKGKTVEIMDILHKKGRWSGELKAERTDGSTFDTILSANIVKNKADEPVCMMASFVDITERKKAEDEIIRTKKYLQNIIDSASEIIISFNKDFKISAWNKTAEKITGYKKNRVIGKHFSKLKIFEDFEKLSDMLNSIVEDKKNVSDEIVINTKNGDKRIIKISYSIIKGEKDRNNGILFIGKDITYEKDAHSKLLKGNSYLISNKNKDEVLDFFSDLIKLGYKGLFITRRNPNNLNNYDFLSDVEIVMLNNDKKFGYENVSSFKDLISKIESFSKNNQNSIILLDRIDYLITLFSFEELLKNLYEINNFISKNKSIFLVRVNPLLLDAQQMAFVEDELKVLPGQKVEGIELDDELYGILKYIYRQNQKNSLVYHKKIKKEFSIVDVTATKRLSMLENKNLIFMQKKGRIKTIHLTDKGQTLLNKRGII